MHTAFDHIRFAVDRSPSRLAIVDDRTARKLTYRQLLDEVEAIAAGLFQRGVRPRDRVAVSLPNTYEHALILLALQRLDAVAALMNFRLPAAQIGALVKDGGITSAIIGANPELVEEVAKSLPAGGALFAVGDPGCENALARCSAPVASLPTRQAPRPDDAAFIFYTSGTTGDPKGVLIPHSSILIPPDLPRAADRASVRPGTADLGRRATVSRHRLFRRFHADDRIWRNLLRAFGIRSESRSRSGRTSSDQLSLPGADDVSGGRRGPDISPKTEVPDDARLRRIDHVAPVARTIAPRLQGVDVQPVRLDRDDGAFLQSRAVRGSHHVRHGHSPSRPDCARQRRGRRRGRRRRDRRNHRRRRLAVNVLGLSQRAGDERRQVAGRLVPHRRSGGAVSRRPNSSWSVGRTM